MLYVVSFFCCYSDGAQNGNDFAKQPTDGLELLGLCSDDDDYDIDFYTVGPVPPESHESQPSPREQLEVSNVGPCQPVS